MPAGGGGATSPGGSWTATKTGGAIASDLNRRLEFAEHASRSLLLQNKKLQMLTSRVAAASSASKCSRRTATYSGTRRSGHDEGSGTSVRPLVRSASGVEGSICERRRGLPCGVISEA